MSNFGHNSAAGEQKLLGPMLQAVEPKPQAATLACCAEQMNGHKGHDRDSLQYMPGTGPWPQQINLHLCTPKHDQARGRTKVTYSYDALEAH
jgi:hypothetical protein